MKQHTPLQIPIPRPCTEDWTIMPGKEGGRYCGSCSKTIFDFSQMTDDELVSYFRHYPDTSCGRFRSTQIDRDIVPVKSRNIFSRTINYAAATILAVLSMKTSFANTLKKNYKIALFIPVIPGERIPIQKVDTVISGIVTDTFNLPLEHVQITLDGQPAAITDKNGFYSFRFIGETKTHQLVFSQDGYMPVYRGYDPSPNNTKLDVTLTSGNARPWETIVMGKIGPPPTRIYFKSGKAKLSRDNKSTLNASIKKLNERP